MAAAGQAQANGELVRHMVESWPPANPRLLFAGMGTGQILDYSGTGFLEPYRPTFTDINRGFLDRLEKRLVRLGCDSYQTAIDDLEDTRLQPPWGGVVVVLVLEHIDWRKGVASLGRLQAERCYIVIQENPPGSARVRPPVGSMSIFQQVRPNLVPPDQLIDAMAAQQYSLIASESRLVTDDKKMTGLVFARQESAI